MIRVVVVDDQELVRAGLRMLCEATPDIEVVGEAGEGAGAVRVVSALLPDVVLMDLRMPGTDGVTATRRILRERPASRVVVLTTFDDDDHLYPALEAGACGFLAKDSRPRELVDAIRRAAAGGGAFGEPVLRRLVGRAVRAGTSPAGTEGDPVPELTPREREVLALLGEGLSNAEIGRRLHLGVTTVKTHVASLLEKTGSANRVHLAVFAVRRGLLP
ncbi:response regulator [Streptomyces calidiresistens]|uniref:Response regulator n=1 Tax=Streptomyces calidiresistens TaxID=1485586 RepID=A0A7W3XW55_9ACTN|nr:response regulator [Streptomyces calidiresistens]